MKNKGCWTTILIVCICLWFIGSCFGNDDDDSSNQSEQVVNGDSESNSHGPDWLHEHTFAKDLDTGGRMLVKFNNDGSLSIRLNDEGFDKFSNEGFYSVSGNHITATLNNGTTIEFTLDEENHRVDTSNGAELKQTVL